MKLDDKKTQSVAGAVSDVLEGKKYKKEEVKYPHMMYSKDGKDEVEVKDKAEHDKYAAKGYGHDKPKMESPEEPRAKGEKEFKAKHTVKKSGENNDGSVTKEGKLPPALQKAIDAKKKKKDDKEVEEVLGFDKDNPKKVSDDEDEKKEKPSKSEESDKQKKYKLFFDKALKKFGVKSPAELKGDKKKEFFDYVDKNYEADNEAD